MTGTQERLAGLTPSKRRLLEELMALPAPEAVTPTCPRPASWLATSGQRRSYLMQRAEPAATFWNMCLGLRVRGTFSAGNFLRAVEHLTRRHEVLSARFGVEDGQVRQVLPASDEPAVSIADVSEQPAELLAQVWRDEHERPFDLDQDPPLRGRLLRLGERDHALFITIHHIVMDGWSANILLRDLDELASAALAGRAPHLPPARLQFSDYATWQQAWLRSWPRLAQSRFWRTELPDVVAPLDLPSGLRRPAEPGFVRGHLPVVLTDDVSAGVRRLAASEGATPYVVLLATFAALVSRLTGADDLVIASPVAGRHQDDNLEQVVGLFANLVPVRCDLRGADTLRQVIRRVRDAARRSLAHQDLPIEDLLAELRPRTPAGRSPLSQLVFALYNYPRHTSLLGGLEVEEFDAEPSDALQTYSPTPVRPDLYLRIHDRAGVVTLSGLLEYNQRVIDQAAARRLIAQYDEALLALLADPDAAR